MADGTIISGLTKMKEEPLSAFDAFDAYCQNGENDNSPPSEHQIENSGHEEMSGQEFDSHKEHEQRAKRRRVSNDVDIEPPRVKDEEHEMGMEDEMKEFAIKNEEFDVEALYNQGTVDDPPALPPTPEKKGKKKDKNRVVSAKIEFTPLENAPKVARQAGLSQIIVAKGAAVYTFGPIDGVEVGAEFDSRDQARLASVHRASVKGIVGSQDVGCTSICVNGGYEDNEDTGYTIVYSGDGGRSPTKDEPGIDQTWTPMNQALFKSFKDHRPIRVLRGQKSKGRCAPVSGYRYDGLYQILRCWISRSLSFGHYKTIKFAMQRLPKQPPIRKLDTVFEEPGFLSNDLSGDWIKMPKHFYLLPQNASLPDPARIQFDDQFGSMTPEELAKLHRKQKRKRIKAENHALDPELRNANGVNSHATEEAPRGRVFKSLDEDGTANGNPSASHWVAVNTVQDQFGNAISMLTSATAEQAGPAAPVIENQEFHKNVNKAKYVSMFPDADTQHPLRGYMKWRTQCHEQQRVIDNLDEVEAAVQASNQK